MHVTFFFSMSTALTLLALSYGSGPALAFAWLSGGFAVLFFVSLLHGGK